MTINIERAGAGRLWVRLADFTSEDVTRLKGILWRRWHPEKKMWSVPDEPGMADRLLALFARAVSNLIYGLMCKNA